MDGNEESSSRTGHQEIPRGMKQKTSAVAVRGGHRGRAKVPGEDRGGCRITKTPGSTPESEAEPGGSGCQ